MKICMAPPSPRTSVGRALLTLFFAFLMAGGTACATDLQEKPINVQPLTLWKLIDLLGHQPSLSPDNLKPVLPVDFSNYGSSASFSFYQGGPLGLADEVVIEEVDLRVWIENNVAGVVILNLGGHCVSIKHVSAHFPNVTRAHFPFSAPAEPPNHSIRESWGWLNFGFKDSSLQCLSSVTFTISNGVHMGPPRIPHIH